MVGPPGPPTRYKLHSEQPGGIQATLAHFNLSKGHFKLTMSVGMLSSGHFQQQPSLR